MYPSDANLIVSLLDLHVPVEPTDNAGNGSADALEILEAGTGHGSLTLHLARAIHAANPAPPSWPIPKRKRISASEEVGKVRDTGLETSNDAWHTWRRQRRAVIHTVDISHTFSKHAEKIVHGFRQGIYAPHVDFHVGDIKHWIAGKAAERQNLLRKISTPFIAHAILDMPSSHQQIANIAPVIRPAGMLLLFAPSITQLGDAVRVIKEQRLPFVMERVLELGSGISGGRDWDVRLATRRHGSLDSKESAPAGTTFDNGGEEEGPRVEDNSNDPSERVQVPETEVANTGAEEVLVCRPKVGKLIVGGGFVGVWRRKKD